MSIDRINPRKNYAPSNCRIIPHRENCGRTRPGDWKQIIARLYEFAKMFPTAADMCWGRPRIDWGRVCDEYMNGDVDALVAFLKEQGYCQMSIWHIRKRLGAVVPQKKSER